MDTTNILFICGGTFVGLIDIIKRRVGRSAIGFANEESPRDSAEAEGEILARVTPEDLVVYGMIPELVGRLPIITTLVPLDASTLVRILTEPANALVKQYRKFFEMEGGELDFTDEALALVAERALERDTGARALRAVLEELMLDAMFELPDRKESGRYVVTEAVVRGEKSLFAPRSRRRRESA